MNGVNVLLLVVEERRRDLVIVTIPSLRMVEQTVMDPRWRLLDATAILAQVSEETKYSIHDVPLGTVC